MSNCPAAPSFAHINTHLVSYSLPGILDIIETALQRIQLQPRPTPPEQTSLFFTLPPEMRQIIYEAAILGDEEHTTSDSEESATTSTSANLLRTCRQVKMEAEPIRYRRPQSFSSQAKLFLWLDRSQDSNLERVHTLTLHLTDVDLSLLLDPMATAPRRHTTAWSIYQDELGKLEDSLRCLPNLSSLTIIPPKDNRSMLLRQFYRLFLMMIPTRCPKLKQLELHDTRAVLDHVPVLNNIREVVFTESQPQHSASRTQSNEREDITETALVMKIETDEADVQSIRSPLSPRTKRRSRVTRVVSD